MDQSTKKISKKSLQSISHRVIFSFLDDLCTRPLVGSYPEWQHGDSNETQPRAKACPGENHVLLIEGSFGPKVHALQRFRPNVSVSPCARATFGRIGHDLLWVACPPKRSLTRALWGPCGLPRAKEIVMSTVNTKPAPLAACTPAAMAKAGVPFSAAHWFHTRARRQGTRSQTELTVFQCVRQLVGSHQRAA